jgi:predicted phage terminase large subunit-like protein
MLKTPTNARVIEVFGQKPMAALWPKEFSLEHLASAKKLDPRGFEALYQGNPTPEDGEYFKAASLVEHRHPSEYPKKDKLRFYAASDHALTEKEENDATCMGVVGVDEHDHIWIMPELVWDRFETDVLVDEMIALMKLRKPQVWWAESEHIEKAIGPFRRKRQMESKAYTTVVPVPSIKDLRTRARNIQGRVNMRMVHFPAWMPWWSKARAEMLKYPRAKHDDFISFLSLIGRGLDQEIGAPKEAAPEKVIRVGSIAWIKAAHKREQAHAERKKAVGGW